MACCVIHAIGLSNQEIEPGFQPISAYRRNRKGSNNGSNNNEALASLNIKSILQWSHILIDVSSHFSALLERGIVEIKKIQSLTPLVNVIKEKKFHEIHEAGETVGKILAFAAFIMNCQQMVINQDALCWKKKCIVVLSAIGHTTAISSEVISLLNIPLVNVIKRVLKITSAIFHLLSFILLQITSEKSLFSLSFLSHTSKQQKISLAAIADVAHTSFSMAYHVLMLSTLKSSAYNLHILSDGFGLVSSGIVLSTLA